MERPAISSTAGPPKNRSLFFYIVGREPAGLAKAGATEPSRLRCLIDYETVCIGFEANVAFFSSSVVVVHANEGFDYLPSGRKFLVIQLPTHF